MIDNRDIEIISFIQNQPGCSSKEIHDKIAAGISYATMWDSSSYYLNPIHRLHQ
jgi:hypothetical protein